MITTKIAYYASLNFSVDYRFSIKKTGQTVALQIGEDTKEFTFQHGFQASCYAFWLNSWVTPLTTINDPRIDLGSAIVGRIKNEEINLNELIDEVESRIF